MESKRKIVIVGANFGGLTTALRLPNHHSVVVIDPGAEFEFLPNVHELLSGVKSPSQLRLSRRRLLQRAGHRFVQDSVTSIDPAAGMVKTTSGRKFSYDVCVVAIGGVNNSSGIPGADAFTMPFKSVGDCEAIGAALRRVIRQRQRVAVVVVGGGLEGVEALGEILRRYRRRTGLSIDVIESGERLLPGLPAPIGQDVRKRSRRYPVRFHICSRVKRATREAVELESGRVIRSDLTIWTGGAAVPALLAESGLAPESGRWASTRATLQSRYFENVFVVGDAADPAAPVAKQSYHAIAMGECVAENIDRFFRGTSLRSFKPGLELNLIAFGDLNTYLVAGSKVIAGSSLASAKEFVYQFNMARYDPALSALPFIEAQARFWKGFRKLALPAILSPASFLRLADVRILKL